jgi:hypothetical protein
VNHDSGIGLVTAFSEKIRDYNVVIEAQTTNDVDIGLEA